MKDILDVFGDLPDYPGKRAPKNRVASSGVTQLIEDPYANVPFKVLVVKGEKQTFYTVGNVARILGRKAQTLRKWESKGWIPPATYRTTKSSGSDLLNTQSKGYRLYSREQVEIIRRALEINGLLGERTKTWQKAEKWNLFINYVKSNWTK
jgi:predicted transcriptional regulator